MDVDAWLRGAPEIRAELQELPALDPVVSRLENGDVLDEGDLFVFKRFLYRSERIAQMQPPHCSVEAEECAALRESIHPESRPGPRFRLSEKLDPAYKNALRARRDTQKRRDALRGELEASILDSPQARGRFDVEGAFRGEVDAEHALPLVRDGEAWKVESAALTQAEKALRDARARVAEASYDLRARLSRALAAHTSELENWAEQWVKLDLRVAHCDLKAAIDGVWPHHSDEAWVSIRNGSAPVLDGAQPVSIELIADSNLVTGPNMGGKSELLRLVGLALYAAHHLLPFPADDLKFGWTESLVYVGSEEPFSGQSDGGLSSFGREVHRIVTSLKRPVGVWLLDEVGRGTHPDDGTTILEKVLNILKNRGDRTLCATHFGGIQVTDHYRFKIKGLDQPEALEAELQALAQESFFDVDTLARRLRRHMNYQPVRVGDQAPPSRDALRIARALGLEIDDPDE